MTPQDVIDRIRPTLNDPDGVRWSDDECLLYVADGQTLVAQLRPTSTSVTEVIALTADQSDQTIPDNSKELLRINRNMGSDGSTPGRSISLTSRAVLNAMHSGWAAEGGIEVEHWVYDPTSDKRTFWVYPFPYEEIYVEMVHSKKPPISVAIDEDLDISDDYIGAMGNYVLYRCFNKDAEYGGSGGRAQLAMQAFASEMQSDLQTLARMDPNINRRTGETPGSV